MPGTSTALATMQDHRQRWQYSLNDLLLIMSVVAVNVTAWTLALRGLPTSDVVQFTAISLTPPILAGVFCYRIARRKAGRTLVQLVFERRFLPTFLSTMWVPLLFVGLLPWIPEPFAALRIGLVTGLTVAATSTCWQALVNRFDLCENGIVSSRVLFMPWKRIKPGRLRLNREGNLEFGRGWIHTTAIILPDQRAAVEAVLQEKSGTANEDMRLGIAAGSPPHAGDFPH